MLDLFEKRKSRENGIEEEERNEITIMTDPNVDLVDLAQFSMIIRKTETHKSTVNG